jgi:UDP-GlcNAc:undecaprenyl-phosphate/decaprenyl-phosphate GlcNAc-1-phosphate transferase
MQSIIKLMLIFWLAIATLLPAFILSCTAVSLIRRLAPRWGLMDRPMAHKVHAAPIPLGGGVGIWFGVAACLMIGGLVVWLSLESRFEILPEMMRQHREGLISKAGDMGWLLLGGTILMLLGLADDRRGISWKLRLIIELTVASAVVYGQGIRLTAFIGAPWLTPILSVLWIVALINSFNMLDNMDGLSGGVAFIASTMLACTLLFQPDRSQPQIFVAAMLLVLCGALLGFLIHNWPPAKIFMGDAGSYFVGYWIAIATLMSTYTSHHSPTQHAILAPLCILAIPLYDMTSVIWIRIREGRSPFQGDRRHFSHRLVHLGMSKKQAVLTIYLATATCGLSSLLLNRTDFFGAVIVLLMVASVLCLIALLEKLAWSRDDK